MKETIEEITGRVDGVGGEDENNLAACITLPDETEMACDVTKSMAIRLGKSMYETVTLKGLYRNGNFFVIELVE